MGTLHSVERLDRTKLKLVRKLGSGGQGSAFEAIYDDEAVCVKQFGRIEFQPTKADLKRISRLKHKNIVRLIGICDGPDFRMVTELCRQSLYDVINKQNLITYRDLVDWSLEIAEGMHYIHSNKIVHRDLKSLNVLIGFDGVVKINDFDFSHSIDDFIDYMNTYCGTLYWMAPELLTNSSYTYKVDVWSYGVLLWEMITQQFPYSKMHGQDVEFGVPKGQITLPVPSGVPEKMAALLQSCLTIKPKLRINFKQVIEKLNEFPEAVDEQSWQRVKHDWRHTMFGYTTQLR